jgi:catechol 2,3-dioxygenase-like lactoylglutathione lyase family enzyme
MQIRRLTLPTAALAALTEFYADVLGFPVLRKSAEAVTLGVGTAQLTFVTAEVGSAPFFHFAFDVAAEAIDAAAGWLQSAAPLLPFEGADIIDFPNWQARSAYVRDPAGNIIECIGRRPLAWPAAGTPFSVRDVHGVSEIGLVVPDVAAFAQRLISTTGLTHFARQAASDRFAVLGTDTGLLIVVPPGRSWFPTNTPSAIFPLEVELLPADEQPLYRLELP